MNSSYYKMYSSYSKEQLLDVLSKEEEYQPEAVEAARKVSAHNGWLDEIEKSIATREKNSDLEIENKAAYYRKAVEFEDDKFLSAFQILPILNFTWQKPELIFTRKKFRIIPVTVLPSPASITILKRRI